MSEIARTWTFESSSGSKEYETIQYEDGSTSCNCPGWTRRNPPGGRNCKHTRAVDNGRADAQSIAQWTNEDTVKVSPNFSSPVKKKAAKAKKEEPKAKGVVRKIVW